MSDDTLTGARLVEAMTLAMANEPRPDSLGAMRDMAIVGVRAQAEAAGVTAKGLGISASILEAYLLRRDVAALLRAMAEVLRDE